MDKLRNDGYILIENIKFKKEFNNSLNSFYNNNNICYKKLKLFIDDLYYPTLNKIINNNNKIYYGKFRFNNNNNSLDSSRFHGDIYNHTNENIVNIYTCLYYFDNSYLEIIPESHRKDYLINNNNHSSFKNIKKISISSDTFVILHSNIHYRQIESTKSDSRLLQIFEVCFNTYDYKKILPKLIIVKTYDSYIIKCITFLSNKLFKNNNNLFVSYFHYFLVYYDLQNKISILSTDLSPNEKYNKLISYEPGKREYINEFNTSETNTSETNTSETNINIICDNNIKNCGPGFFYLYCTFIYWIISATIFYFIHKKATNK